MAFRNRADPASWLKLDLLAPPATRLPVVSSSLNFYDLIIDVLLATPIYMT